MLSYYFLLTFRNDCEKNKNEFLQMRPDFRPPLASDEPTRGSGRIFLFHFTQQFDVRRSVPLPGSGEPCGKGISMTFDLERYRADIAPLNLPKEQEDELLRDLWAMSEALVDQSFISPTYPLQLALTRSAFDAIEEALALVSKEPQNKEEEVSCP
ncbi:hypothetical protein [Roseibium alexandrii]|uniref:hypothetical protein n=1 Tax=Roseibium alexandrii TaxID=388408 RepID=UPI003752C59A